MLTTTLMTLQRGLANKYQIKDDSVEPKLVLTAFLPFYKHVEEGYFHAVEQEKNKLTYELAQLNFLLECEKDDMIKKEIKWCGERDDLREQNKKLEYKIAELLKAGDKNNEKLKRIKFIYDE